MASDTISDMDPPCIAIIDDDLHTRSLFSTYLSKQGYKAVTAADGKAGIELIRSQPRLDAVLLDLHMPEVSGFDVMREAKATLADTPVIVVSGTGHIEEALKAIQLGASDFLLKPIAKLSVIGHTIEKNIERSALKRKAKAYRQQLEQTVRKLKDGALAAKKIQKRMLPPATCELCGFRVTGDLLPMDYLSGDFYDYIALDATNLIFYLADISGHGVASSLVTVLLKSFVNKSIDLFRKSGDDAVLRPDKLLAQLIAELYAEQLGKYMTIFYGHIDMASKTLWYANGGHFPPPLIIRNETVEYATAGGGPVGLFPEVKFETGRIDISDTFSMFLFSDGILDAMQAGTTREKLETLREHVLNGTFDGFYSGLKQLAERLDDLSLVTLERITPS